MAAPRLIVLALAATAWGEDMVCDKDSEGSCAPSMLEVKKASVKKHEAADGADGAGEKAGDELVAGTASWRAKWGYSSSYCSEETNYEGCWDNKPTTTEECTPYSGKTTCNCGSGISNCNMDLIADGVSGRCAEIKVYVGGGHAETRGSDFGVQGTSEETFCTRMVLHDQWRQKGLIATTPEKRSKEAPWWAPWALVCPNGYTAKHWYDVFNDGKCHRKKRYLGERCWQELGEEGTCVGVDRNDVYKTACYEGRCTQYAGIRNREQCTCSKLGWHLLVMCSAADNGCNGHACVMNSGNGNFYCDYGTEQDWHTWHTIISR